MPTRAYAGPEEPSANSSPQRVRSDEEGERGLAVDLDDGDPLSIPRLEVGVAGDVDELELERMLAAHGFDYLERPLAEVTARGVVDDDPGQGYRPRVVVASETRWSASP